MLVLELASQLFSVGTGFKVEVFRRPQSRLTMAVGITHTDLQTICVGVGMLRALNLESEGTGKQFLRHIPLMEPLCRCFTPHSHCRLLQPQCFAQWPWQLHPPPWRFLRLEIWYSLQIINYNYYNGSSGKLECKSLLLLQKRGMIAVILTALWMKFSETVHKAQLMA